MANSVDPDQMLHSAASDLGLHCLLGPIFLNALGKNKGRINLFSFVKSALSGVIFYLFLNHNLYPILLWVFYDKYGR